MTPTIGQLENKIGGLIYQLIEGRKNAQKPLGDIFEGVEKVLRDLQNLDHTNIEAHLLCDLEALCEQLCHYKQHRDPRLKLAMSKQPKLKDGINSLCRKRLPQLRLVLTKPAANDPEFRVKKHKM